MKRPVARTGEETVMDPKDMLGVLLHSTDEQQNAIAGQSLETKPSPFLHGQRALSTFSS